MQEGRQDIVGRKNMSGFVTIERQKKGTIVHERNARKRKEKEML